MLYEYKMVQAAMNVIIKEGDSKKNIAADYLQDVVNRYAAEGWEFYRIDTLGVNVQPGCLSMLLGHRETTTLYNIISFRREKKIQQLKK